MTIQITIISCGSMVITLLSVCLTIYNTEVYQKPINERWGVIVV